MSLAHGTSIVRDGLVFAYDMDNTKRSWRGAPYKNELLSDVGWSGDGSNQTGFNKSNIVITNTKLMYDGLPTVLYSPGTSRNCYLSGSGDIDFSSVSTEWTFSCYVKREDGLPITTMSVYMYYPSSDGAGTGTIRDVGNGWYQISRSRTGSSNYISLVGFTGMSSNVKYYLSGPMLTKTQFPVHSVPAQVTRSNAESLIDISKNRQTIEPTNMNYLADGSIGFNGSSSYIDLGSDLTLSPDYQGWTAEYWFKTDNAGTLQHFNSAEGDVSNSNWLALLSRKLAVWNVSPGYWRYGDTLIDSNTWYQAVFIADQGGTNMRLYINGEREGGDHVGNEWAEEYSSLECRYIGRYEHNGGYSRYWDGKIDLVRLYNRPLTDQEVKQNYEATKGRFQ